MPHADTALSIRSSTARPVLPDRASTGWFVVLVLALAGLQTLSSLLEWLGMASPAWLGQLTTVLGGAFAPVWAMLVVGGVTLGWPAMRQLLRQSLRVRLSLRLYLATLIVPFVVLGLAVLASGTRPGGTDAEPLELMLQILVLAPPFALAEQLGWRAWLQRGLQSRLAPALAGLLVGLVWVGHHLPLFAPDSQTLHSELPLGGFLVLVTAYSVLLAAVYNAADGSVLPVVVAHLSFNVAVQLALPVARGESTPLMLTAAALFVFVAGGVAWWSRARATEQRPAVL